MANSYSYHILVTDKNHHVRDLLVRELNRDGCVTYNVNSCLSAYRHILSNAPLDLVILDPELFKPGHLDLFRQILQGLPTTPIIIHTYPDTLYFPGTMRNIFVITKNADSVIQIKETIQSLRPHQDEKTAEDMSDPALRS